MLKQSCILTDPYHGSTNRIPSLFAKVDLELLKRARKFMAFARINIPALMKNKLTFFGVRACCVCEVTPCRIRKWGRERGGETGKYAASL